MKKYLLEYYIIELIEYWEDLIVEWVMGRETKGLSGKLKWIAFEWS